MIRPMMKTDIPYVQNIVKQSWEAAYFNLIPHHVLHDFQDSMNRSYSEAMIDMRMERTNVLIAECEGVPVGFANFTRIDEDGDSELTALYVLPSHQHEGYGTKLLDCALTILQDAQQLFFYIDSINTNGRSFIEKQGFDLVDVFDEYVEGHSVNTAQYVYKVQVPMLV